MPLVPSLFFRSNRTTPAVTALLLNKGRCGRHRSVEWSSIKWQCSWLFSRVLFGSKEVENADRLRRFIQEAKSASALNHPHIITIYEVGEATAEFLEARPEAKETNAPTGELVSVARETPIRIGPRIPETRGGAGGPPQQSYVRVALSDVRQQLMLNCCNLRVNHERAKA